VVRTRTTAARTKEYEGCYFVMVGDGGRVAGGWWVGGRRMVGGGGWGFSDGEKKERKKL